MTATLVPTRITVEPGASASCELHIRGLVADADTLRFEVIGEAAAWSWVVPPGAPGPVGGEVVARVVLRPPRASTPAAGEHPLAIRVLVSGDDSRETSAEGTVVVGSFAEVAASLRPATAEGRSSSTHELDITVNANSPVRLSMGSVPSDALDIRVSPSSLVGTSGEPCTTQVVVRPRKRLLRGAAITHRFELTVTPEGGRAVNVAGEMHQQPWLAGRLVPAGAGLVLGLVVLLLLRSVLGSGRAPAPVTDRGSTTTAAAVADGCPASGHRDTFVSGLTPERIPTLPPSYSFSFVKSDGCSPVRFNPCQPVHFVLSPAQAPPTGAADVREAFARLGRATGIQFVDDGVTDETSRRAPFLADRYPGRWAPILVVWTHQSGGRGNIEVVGSGFPDRVGDVLVSGTLTLNADAVSNVARKTPLPGGFGSGGGPGIGAIGAEGVTWGRVILHELAHIMGLGHTRDRDQLMYPDTADQTSHTTDYRSGDRDGLRLLGREAGCIADGPVPG